MIVVLFLFLTIALCGVIYWRRKYEKLWIAHKALEAEHIHLAVKARSFMDSTSQLIPPLVASFLDKQPYPFVVSEEFVVPLRGPGAVMFQGHDIGAAASEWSNSSFYVGPLGENVVAFRKPDREKPL